MEDVRAKQRIDNLFRSRVSTQRILIMRPDEIMDAVIECAYDQGYKDGAEHHMQVVQGGDVNDKG